jgi:hypothetical protein
MEIQMNNHTDLINYIAKKIQAKSYLEIGTNNCKNFNSIQVAHKVGVDPDKTSPCAIHKTSDEFFKINKMFFDLVFVDGMHECEQVKRDILNSWNFLSEKGCIVVHDCSPSQEVHTHVPRDSKVWNGDVYKAICQLTGGHFTIDMDYGCCVIKKPGTIGFDKGLKPKNWEFFIRYRWALLNLVSIEDGLKLIDNGHTDPLHRIIFK